MDVEHRVRQWWDEWKLARGWDDVYDSENIPGWVVIVEKAGICP